MPGDVATIKVILPNGIEVQGEIRDRSRFGVLIAYEGDHGQCQNWFSPSTAVRRQRSPAEKRYIDRFGAAVVGPP